MREATKRRSDGATKGRARRRGRQDRRGLALMDVIIGGIMLGIGLTVILSITSRALSSQTDGEKRMTAGWLADELLNMVVAEGPVRYPQVYDMNGRFREPFEEFGFSLDIEDLGLGAPFQVNAMIYWPSWDPVGRIEVQTLVAQRQNDDPELNPREPEEPIDRDARWFDDEFDSGGGRASGSSGAASGGGGSSAR